MYNVRMGWDDITDVFKKLYPSIEPKHYSPIIKYSVGGKDPLDGVSVYDAGDYYHFVTYGFSEIYERENSTDLSGFGFELTFKLKKTKDMTEEEISNTVVILQKLARYVFNTRKLFKPMDYIYSPQTEGMDLNGKSKITGFITVEDKDAKTIDSINGKLQFLELIGVTNEELQKIINKEEPKETIINKIIANYSDVTDYSRA